MTPDPTSPAPGYRVRRPLREEEPFATMAAFPRRFGVGIPVVFVLSILSGSLVANVWSLSGGVAVLLVLQTMGLLGLYLPALQKRRASEAHRSSDLSS
jgi:hypothetical protein